MRKILLLMAIISAMTAGCGSETNENGVVATVNGRCIHLTQLETEYDFKHMDWSQGVDTNVEQLKSDYSRIVLNLVVEELVSQELQRRGLSVTDEELKAAEDRIRADYPEGAFEQVLIEEYIDLNEWRGRLKARLAMEKFYKEVLRPRVKLDYEEAEAYYREHISDFYLPDRIRFYLIQAPSEEMIKRALDIYETNGSVEDVSAKFNRVQVLDRWTPWRAWNRDRPAGSFPGNTGTCRLSFWKKYPGGCWSPPRPIPWSRAYSWSARWRRLSIPGWLRL